MSNPYESPRGTDSEKDGPSAFPWPRVRRLLRPLFTALFLVAIIAVMMFVLGSKMEAGRQQLRRSRAEYLSKIRQETPARLSGDESADQP